MCLGFEVPDGFLAKVNYVDEPLTFEWDAIEAGNGYEDVKAWWTTKFSHWSYENEFRGVIRLKEADSRGLYFFHFGENLELREVIVGPNCTISRAEVREALNGLDEVECFSSRLAFGSYRVVRQQDGTRWK
jgi:hypothetical protein